MDENVLDGMVRWPMELFQVMVISYPWYSSPFFTSIWQNMLYFFPTTKQSQIQLYSLANFKKKSNGITYSCFNRKYHLQSGTFFSIAVPRFPHLKPWRFSDFLRVSIETGYQNLLHKKLTSDMSFAATKKMLNQPDILTPYLILLKSVCVCLF